MAISMNVKSKHFMKELGKRGNQLQVVAADTVNESTEEMRSHYNTRLKKKTKVRTKFTTKASKTFKSNPVRRGGQPRQLSQINSKLVVRNMKGGKEHYLSKLENDTVQRGGKLTRGKVPVPLNTSRVSGNYDRSIAKGNRLLTGKTQVLKAGGRPFGVTGDKRRNGKPWRSSGQRFAALYGYRKRGTGNFQGDLNKPFFFIDNSNRLGIFKFKGKRVRKIRKLEKSTVKHKAEPHFQNSVKQESPKRIQQRFIRNAQKKLGR